MGTMEINEFNQEKLRLLDTEQLLAFYGIFGTLSSPKAEAMVKGIARELKRRKYTLGEENLNEVDVKGLLKGLAKGTRVAGKALKTAIKVAYPIAKDMVKATWMTAKKIGGSIGDLMDDPEFRKLFTKYVDNPEDPDRLKKVQAYADSILSDTPVSGMESAQMKKLRIEKVCSIVLGEDFNKDFIYEDVDFTKPSTIKEAYKAYRQESLEEGKSVKIKTRAGSDKYDYDELLPEVQKIVIMSKAVAKNHRMNVAKKITKAIIAGKIKNADISSDLATLIGIDQPYAGHAPTRVIKDQLKKLKLESTDLEEADNRLVAHTPAAAKRLIKKLKNRFSGYSWDQRIKGDEIIYPNESPIKRFIKKQPEVADMKESTELEEAKKVIAQVELWNGKKMKKSFKNQSAAEKFIKKMQDQEDVRGYNMYAEGLEEASDKDLDIKSIKALIKKPSPEMIKKYGGKDKYIKMLKSKLAKLESTDLE